MNAHDLRPNRDIETALASQRVAASGMLSARVSDGRTRLHRLVQEGAAKLRMPATTAGPLETVLINTAGGMTGGDRLAWTIEAEARASVVATTQACEKVYRSAGGHAETSVRLTVGPAGRIAWLPQETIVFDGGAFKRRLDVDLAAGAEVLLVEATLFGRTAMGETVRRAEFRDRWRVRQGGRLVHAEDFAIGPAVSDALLRPAAARGAVAVAAILLVAGDAEDRLDAARGIVGDEGGVSAWKVGESGKLLARLVASDGYSLRRRLLPLVELLNGRAALPKVWSL